MAYAGMQVLRSRYGGGHYATVASHGERWSAFSSWARDQGIRDMRAITRETIESYASHLRGANLAVATVQNRVSTVNVILSHAREGAWESVSPRELAGASRTSVRVEAPASLDPGRYRAAHAALEAAGLHRAAAVYALARAFGLRSEEASKANLDRLQTEAERGRINIVDGTKGGRTAPRWVPVTPVDREILAAALVARPEGSRNLLRPGESYRAWREGELRAGREILHAHGIRGYHDARAAYACERYRDLTGHIAPAVAGRRQADRATDRSARVTLAHELGHGRTDVVSAYAGSAR